MSRVFAALASAFVCAVLVAPTIAAEVLPQVDTIEETFTCMLNNVGCVRWNLETQCTKLDPNDDATCACDECWSFCSDEEPDGETWTNCLYSSNPEERCFATSRVESGELPTSVDYGCGCRVGNSTKSEENCDCRGIGTVDCGNGCGVACAPPPPVPALPPPIQASPPPSSIPATPPPQAPPAPHLADVSTVLNATSVLVGYRADDFVTVSRRNAFKSAIAGLLNGVSRDDVDINAVVDVYAKRRRRRLMSSADLAVEISYGIVIVSSSSDDASRLSNELTSGDVLTALRSAGLSSVSSVTVTVDTPIATEPENVSSDAEGEAPVNDAHVIQDEDPDFTTARILGLLAGTATMLFLSLFFRRGKSFVARMCGGHSNPRRASNDKSNYSQPRLAADRLIAAAREQSAL